MPRHSIPRRVVIGAGCAVACMMLAGCSAGGERYSAFGEPATDADALPASVVAMALENEDFGLELDSARFRGTSESATYWIAKGVGDGAASTCIVSVNLDDEEPFSACGESVTAFSAFTGETALLVPDGMLAGDDDSWMQIGSNVRVRQGP